MAEYITKKQVIEWYSCYGHDDKQIRFEDLSFDIQHMIPEDVAPVQHGKWEKSRKYKGYCSCSLCHDCYIEPEWVEKLKWKYCPTCGAKMDLEEKNDSADI